MRLFMVMIAFGLASQAIGQVPIEDRLRGYINCFNAMIALNPGSVELGNFKDMKLFENGHLIIGGKEETVIYSGTKKTVVGQNGSCQSSTRTGDKAHNLESAISALYEQVRASRADKLAVAERMENGKTKSDLLRALKYNEFFKMNALCGRISSARTGQSNGPSRQKNSAR